MSFTVFEIVAVFVLCGLVKWLVRLDAHFLETKRGKIAQGLLSLVGTIGWAAFAAFIIIWALRQVDDSSLQDTIGGINATIDRLKAWLDYSWLALLLLGAAALLALLILRNAAAETGARRAGTALKWTGRFKAIFLLLAMCSFVSAERNGSVRAALAEAGARRATLVDAQLVLFQKVEIALIREAINSAIEDDDDDDLLAATVQSYGPAAAYASPPLAQSFDFDGPFTPPPPPGGFEPAEQATITDVEKAAAPALEVTAGKAQEKLVDDLVKIAFGKGTGALKSAYLDLGHPLLNSLLDAVVDPVFLDPVREMAARQANRLLKGETGWRDARDNARRLGASLAASMRARLAGLGPMTSDAPFGEPEWDRVRVRMDEIIENGIPRKTELVQAETRARFHEVRDLRGAIRTLLFATPGRAAAEERAFGRILDDHPVYAALWGYGVIGMTPPGLESRLRTISIADTGTRATRIRDAMVEASLGDVDLRNTLFEMGFDPDRDRGLSIGQIKEKLYDVHGPYPVDGYKLYYSVTQPVSVDRAVSYFKSDTVGEAVGTYCPAG